MVALDELYAKKELAREYFNFIETAKFRQKDAIYTSRYDKEKC